MIAKLRSSIDTMHDHTCMCLHTCLRPRATRCEAVRNAAPAYAPLQRPIFQQSAWIETLVPCMLEEDAPKDGGTGREELTVCHQSKLFVCADLQVTVIKTEITPRTRAWNLLGREVQNPTNE